MNEDNKHNILFFSSTSMQGLYDSMNEWQNANKKRFLSLNVQQENGEFCCIALTNPSEVVIVGKYGHEAKVSSDGEVYVYVNDRRF
jgi:hypothetical protein